MTGQRAAAWGVRLLLLTTLLLGFTAMHALGHPDGSHGHHGQPSAAAAAAHPGHAPAAHGAPGPTAPDAEESGAKESGGADTGLNPTLVCLAVLALGGAAALSAAPHARRRARALGATTARWRSRAPAAPTRPPPRHAVRLAHLSVLRI